MPRFDGTGPEGRGPRTGRVLGKCNPDNNNSKTDISDRDFPAGAGRGRGYGRGFGAQDGRGAGRGFGLGRGRR